MRLMQRITSEDNLYAAWRAVRANRGGPGTDAVCLTEYEESLSDNLDTLRTRLRDESYVPLSLRRATMPKRGGGERALAIPAVSDRVAQRAFVQVLEGIFEPIFLPCSFGYRPGRGVADAVEVVLEHRANGLPWVLDADVRDFFPSVDHGLLLAQLRRHVSDRDVLRVIGLWLEAGALDGAGASHPSLLALAAAQVRTATQAVFTERMDETPGADWEGVSGIGRRPLPSLLTRFGTEAARLAWDNRRTLLPLLATRGALVGGGAGVAVLGAAVIGQHVLAGLKPRSIGTPQGGPISPLLSNVYLHVFDERMTAAGLRLVRYADDFVVCCASEARAKHAREVAAMELSRLRLALHSDKTRIVACADPLRFLGHEFDTDGAFPVQAEPSLSPALEVAKHGAAAAGQAARKGAAIVGQAARQGAQAAQSGARAARKSGTAVAGDIAGRWREHHNRKGQQ